MRSMFAPRKKRELRQKRIGWMHAIWSACPCPTVCPQCRPARSRICLRILQAGIVTTTAITALMTLHRPVMAGPIGGSVVEGTAGISHAGSVTNIDQSTNKAIINWQGFSIGVSETVNFNQPSSSAVTLNRVIGNETSVISGALNANGQVFIVNSAGVLFTKGAQINVGGLVASTLDISNANFMSGKYFFSGTSPAAVVNQGRIHANPGGYVALLGKTVSNEGVISATLGTVAMASGTKVTLNFEGNSLIDVTIDQGTLKALVENKHLIKADGGRVILTAKAADAVLSAQVNNTGIIQARTIAALKGGSGARAATHYGYIKLLASGGTAKVAGKLDASAPKRGNGGTIETSGSRVKIADGAVITTKAKKGKNGLWLIDPDGFIIGAGGDINGSELGTQLDSNNITLDSTHGHGTGGNIDVNAPVSWGADTILTLSASNNININSPIIATGANAGLVLNYGGYAATGNVKAGTDYTVNNITTGNDGSLTIGASSMTLSGTNASVSINGQAYQLIHSMSGLSSISVPVIDPNTGQQAIDPDSGLPVFAPASGHYALAQDLDASGTTYHGAVVDTLTGTLAGLGHKISNLNIIDSSTLGRNVGLIGNLGSVDNTTFPGTITGAGIVRDIGLMNASIAEGPGGGSIGAVVGTSNGNGQINSTISNAYVTGATVAGFSQVGGLVGNNQGIVDNAHAVVAVSSTNAGSDVGGLAGINFGIISNSTAKGTVTAAGVPNDTGGLENSSNIGGLVGTNGRPFSNPDGGVIRNSHAYVDVITTESQTVGGLVGANVGGTITDSSAKGTLTASWSNLQVNGANYGGFVGQNSDGIITGSQADVNVTVAAKPGTIDGQVFDSFVANVGGFVGSMEGGSISNAGTTGNVTTIGVAFGVGGFFGQTVFGAIGQSTSIGQVTTEHNFGDVGGFGGTVWDGATLQGNTLITDRGGHAIGQGVPDGVSVFSPFAAAVVQAAAQAAAREAGAQTVLTATTAATVISTTDVEDSATRPPKVGMSTAGTQATKSISGPKIDDNVKIDEPKAVGASPEGQGVPRHAATTTTARRGDGGGKGGGFGAAIRSIEVDGQRFDLERGGAQNRGRSEKAR